MLRALRRLTKRRRKNADGRQSEAGENPRRQYKHGYYSDKEDLSERWDDIAQIVDLRPSDVVLDMGCAEGLISFEVAKRVSRVDGIEISRHLLERAQSRAEKDGVGNVSFSVGSVIDSGVTPGSYDVVLFLGVMGKRAGARRVGLAELERMLAATRRQIIVRVNVQKRAYLDEDDDFRLHEVLTTMDRHGFDAICFDKREGHGNLIVGNRRGTDARLHSALPHVVIPMELLPDHPCLRGVSIAASDHRGKAFGR
jgi:SAM-dependent methyltransferase